MSRLVLIALLAASTVGCARGDYRRVDLSEDLTSSDLTHYRGLAEKAGRNKLEDYVAAVPLFIAPVISRARESSANVEKGTASGFHFEDMLSTLLILANRIEVANYDDEGKSLSYQKKHQVLLGLVSFTQGHRGSEVGTYQRTGGFSLLWSCLGYERTTRGRTLRLLWIPISWG